MKVLSRHLPGWPEENHKIVQNNRCLYRDSNQVPPEYESGTLQLLYPVEVYLHAVLASDARGDWSASSPGRFAEMTKLGGWVGPRAGLDNIEKRNSLAL
jgi:hypothetical protein